MSNHTQKMSHFVNIKPLKATKNDKRIDPNLQFYCWLKQGRGGLVDGNSKVLLKKNSHSTVFPAKWFIARKNK